MKLPIRPVQAFRIAMLCVALPGCSREADTIRQYEEIYLAPPAPSTSLPGLPEGHPALDQPALAGLPELSWETPEGWVEKPGSGMRLVTFLVGPEATPSECTIVTFPGDVGGEAAKLRRWAGQLNIDLPGDRLATLLAGKESFTTAGGFAAGLHDFTGLTGDQETSMLASIVELDGAQAFVKLTGPAPLLRQERARFLALSKSLKK
jgi:hypothetical protein